MRMNGQFEHRASGAKVEGVDAKLLGTCDDGERPHYKGKTCTNWKTLEEEEVNIRGFWIWLLVVIILVIGAVFLH